MRIRALVSVAVLSLAVATCPLTFVGIEMSAMAKGGNGGGNGGGGANGGGGTHGSGANGQSQSRSGDIGSSGTGTHSKRSAASEKKRTERVETSRRVVRENKMAAQLAGLNSLNRNYRAYMHTSDRRMTAIAAYTMAYARYELDNGTEPPIDDPRLGDAALANALASATKTGAVSAAVLERAKTILGVGSADGKIDQIRASLAPAASDL